MVVIGNVMTRSDIYRINTERKFKSDYNRYRNLISQIVNWDLSIEEDIKYITFSDIIKYNKITESLTDVLLKGINLIMINNWHPLDIAKMATIALIKTYWRPLINLGYNYVYNTEFQSRCAYSDMNDLIFTPTREIKVYELNDIRNNIVYVNDIYDRNIKGIDKDINKIIDNNDLCFH